MFAEAAIALGLGLIAIWLVLQPLVRPGARRPEIVEPIDPEETPKGLALAALKEIEFDRETGKLSDADYELLKAKYTTAALTALRQEGDRRTDDPVEALVAARLRLMNDASDRPQSSSDSACATCGPRPESDALYCSTCGRPLAAPAECARCQAPVVQGARFCAACGMPVAA